MRRAALVITTLVMVAAACGDAATTTTVVPPASTTTATPTTTTTTTTPTTTTPTTTTTTLVPLGFRDHVAFDGEDWRLAYVCTEPTEVGTEYFGPFDQVMGGVGFEVAGGRVTAFELEWVRYTFDGATDMLTVTETPATVTIAGQVIPRTEGFGDEPLDVASTFDLEAAFPCLQLRSDGLRSGDFGDDPEEAI